MRRLDWRVCGKVLGTVLRTWQLVVACVYMYINRNTRLPKTAPHLRQLCLAENKHMLGGTQSACHGTRETSQRLQYVSCLVEDRRTFRGSPEPHLIGHSFRRHDRRAVALDPVVREYNARPGFLLLAASVVRLRDFEQHADDQKTSGIFRQFREGAYSSSGCGKRPPQPLPL